LDRLVKAISIPVFAAKMNHQGFVFSFFEIILKHYLWNQISF